MLRWLLLLSVVLFVGAQEVDVPEDKGCCTPDQWEGSAGELIGVAPRFRRSRAFATGVRLSYDYNSKKFAETIYLPRRNISVGLIFDFAGKKMYRFSESRQKCKVRALKNQFKRFCIPDSARALGSYYVGAGSAKLRVTSYAAVLPKMKSQIFFTVSTGCIPISETITGSRRLTSFMMEVGFANITPGIKDPSVFNPPSFCQQDYMDYEDAQDEELDEELVKYLHERLME